MALPEGAELVTDRDVLVVNVSAVSEEAPAAGDEDGGEGSSTDTGEGTAAGGAGDASE